MYVQGIVKGKTIELAQPIGFPNGMNIMINIQPLKPTYQEQQALVDKLCGVWQDDSSIPKIFSRSQIPFGNDFTQRSALSFAEQT